MQDPENQEPKVVLQVEQGVAPGEEPTLSFLHVPSRLSFSAARALAHDILHHIGEAIGEAKFGE